MRSCAGVWFWDLSPSSELLGSWFSFLSSCILILLLQILVSWKASLFFRSLLVCNLDSWPWAYIWFRALNSWLPNLKSCLLGINFIELFFQPLLWLLKHGSELLICWILKSEPLLTVSCYCPSGNSWAHNETFVASSLLYFLSDIWITLLRD